MFAALEKMKEGFVHKQKNSYMILLCVCVCVVT